MLFAFLTGMTVYSQERNSFFLSGTIVNEWEDKEGIAILNITGGHASVSDKEGKFSILVRESDTLEIRAIQFVTERLIVTSYIKQTPHVKIRLTPKVNELKEVTVSPYSLSGRLGSDIKQIDTKEADVAFTTGIPNVHVKKIPQSERRLIEALSGGGIIALNPILNAISGRTKRLKRIIALEKKEYKLESTRERFDTLAYVEFFKIPAKKIDDFIFFCAEDPEFFNLYVKEDQLAMMEFLKKKGLQYRKLNSLD